MDFKTFQANCKYADWGIKPNTVRDFELTCRKSDNVSSGCSWGVCDERNCPDFGIEVTGGVIIDRETGKVVFTMGKGRVKFGK